MLTLPLVKPRLLTNLILCLVFVFIFQDFVLLFANSSFLYAIVYFRLLTFNCYVSYVYVTSHVS